MRWWQQGLVLGRPSAPVEMEMFIDVQCPICQRYEVESLPTIVNKYIKTGKVQLHMQPWAFIGGAGSQSFSGRLGLIAASEGPDPILMGGGGWDDPDVGADWGVARPVLSGRDQALPRRGELDRPSF